MPAPEYVSKTESELRQLAVDIVEGKVFTDKHDRGGLEYGDIWLPIRLGAFAEWSTEDLKRIGMLYEYVNKAGDRSVNGYPTFLSLNALDMEDNNKVWKFHEQYVEMRNNFLGISPIPSEG
jgi:hypothetical protein